MKVKFDDQQVITDLREIIAEKGPGYVYPRAGRNGEQGVGCRYFEDDGSPSCIVGQVLAKHEVDRWDMTTDDYGDMNEDAGVSELCGHGIIQTDLLTEKFLVDMQLLQDRGVPWAAAFEVALGRHELRKNGEHVPSDAAHMNISHLLGGENNG